MAQNYNKLINMKFNASPADRTIDPKTREMIDNFQDRHKIKQRGFLTLSAAAKY